MQEKARQAVADYLHIDVNDVYVVWFCKTLQNHKTILSTDKVKGYIFEATYNGDKKEMYLDCYIKKDNIRIPD